MSAVLASAIAQVGPHFGPPDRAFDGGDHPWRWVIGLAMLAIALAAIAVAVVALVRVNRAAAASAPTTVVTGASADARALLDDRLARGEIDPADYEARRALLESPTPSAPGTTTA